MRLEEYDEIIQYIVMHPSKCSRNVLSDVVLKFSGRFPHDTLVSIFLTNLQRHVKLSYHAKTKADNLKNYYSLYQERIQKVTDKGDKAGNVLEPGNYVQSCTSTKSFDGDKEPGSVLIELGNQFELPPCLMARLVVEQYIKSIIAQTSNGLGHAGQEEKTLNLSQSKFCNKESNVNQVNKVGLLRVGKDTECELDIPMHIINDHETQCSEQKIPGCKNEKLQQTNLSVTSKIQPIKQSRIQLSSNLNTESTSGGAGANDLKENSPAIKLISVQTSVKNKLTSWMKDPNLIPDSVLREQVLQCMSYDVCYGPINDAIRSSIGLEYEEKLVQSIKKLNLPFLDENDLRKRGYDKTPDVKLEVPIVVDSHPICWIESKATFGDLETHSDYLRDQYYSYWNRFGPGLVIYWFGFVDQIAEGMLKQGILIMDAFPSKEKIVFMDP